MSIKICNLTKKFGNKTVIDNISLNIENNGLYAIVGRSGIGKSTLINILSGLDNQTSGKIYLGESQTASNKLLLQKSIAVIYQEYYLINGMSVYENIEIAMQLSGKSVDKSKVTALLDELNLSVLADRKVESLSGGEKQRVAIARAYLADKQIIVADEPTGNLDDENAKIVFELLKKVAKDKIVIIVSHDRYFVDSYADCIFEIENGALERKKENTSVNSKSALSGDIRTSKLSFGNYVKLISHIAFKKKLLLSAICALLLIIMIVMSTVLSMLAVNNGDVMMNNVGKNMPSIAAVKNRYIENDPNLKNDILDSYSINYSKGFEIFDATFDINLDYSNENQDLFYYMFDKVNFQTFIEYNGEIDLNLHVGGYPKNSLEVVLPEYFVNQLIFSKTHFDGAVISQIDDVIGKKLNLLDYDYVVTGVYKSDTFYADKMAEYTINDLSDSNISENVNKIIKFASEAPSLTSLYFGNGFRSDFLSMHRDDLSNLFRININSIDKFTQSDFFNAAVVDVKELNAEKINKIIEYNLAIISDRSGGVEDYLEDFEPIKLILLATSALLLIFCIALSVLLINLQYKDMQKDIGIMMSFGAKRKLILGLFTTVHSIIFALLIIFSGALSIAALSIVNSLFGIAGINIFTWNAISLFTIAISLITIGAAVLVMARKLKKKNLIENLREI